MKNKIIKESKGIFKLPEKTYYFGKIKFGAPYFNPTGFVSSIIKIRKLKLNTPEYIAEKNEKYPHLKNNPSNKYANYPMVRRAKNKIIKIFGNDYYISLGKPIAIQFVELGWKDKWNSPRYEWSPQFVIFFFGLQFCIWWNAPKLDGEKYPDNDKYYEMILRYVKYSNKDIIKAEKDWGWIDHETKKSTWNKKYLL